MNNMCGECNWPLEKKIIIDCIGCLHGHYPKLEGGDLLIITGIF